LLKVIKRTDILKSIRNFSFQKEHFLLLPGLIIMLVFTVYPIVYLIKTASFINIDNTLKFSLIENITKMLKDVFFWNALKNTLEYVFLAVLSQIIIAVALAIFFQSLKGKFINFIRAIILMPSLTPNVVVGIIWLLLYHPFGLVNFFTTILGLGQHMFLANPKIAMYSVILVDTWQWMPIVFLIILAGVSNLPESPFEAAKIDGASSWQILRYITLPLLKPTILVATIFRTVDAFRAFDKLVSLTFGGPADRTTILSIHLYKVTFRHLRWGYGATVALTLILLSLGASSMFIKLTLARKK